MLSKNVGWHVEKLYSMFDIWSVLARVPKDGPPLQCSLVFLNLLLQVAYGQLIKSLVVGLYDVKEDNGFNDEKQKFVSITKYHCLDFATKPQDQRRGLQHQELE